MRSFHAAVTPDLPLVSQPEGAYDAAAQVFRADGQDANAWGSGGSTKSWHHTNGGTDCSNIYTDDSRSWWQ